MTGAGSGRGPSDESSDFEPPDGSADRFEATADAVLDALPEIVYVLDDQGRLVDWNERLETTTGYGPSELAGRQGISLVADEDDRALAECVVGVLDRGEPVSRDVSLVTADGEVLPHRVTAGPICADGEPVAVAGTATDISDRQARERSFEEENARLERFASIVSHDLRNPLAVADGYLELAQRESDAPYLDEIEAAHDRMRQLIDDVLTLTRSGADLEETSAVDLTGVATDAWSVVDTGDARLRVTDLGTVEGDRSRLRQLFENLFRNSVEHGGEGVEVTVAATDEGFYVADDGLGLSDGGGDPFEDGVTTKPNGTGLGLSIVESIATAHGWEVEATESEGGGARFEFRV
jgi:PAS domain S-box-containing protein